MRWRERQTHAKRKRVNERQRLVSKQRVAEGGAKGGERVRVERPTQQFQSQIAVTPPLAFGVDQHRNCYSALSSRISRLEQSRNYIALSIHRLA